jgi:hypothetical protein
MSEGWQLVIAVPVDERFERAAELGREIFFTNGTKQGDRRFVGLELGDAAGAGGKVPFELGVDLGRQMMFDEIRQEAHDVGAVAFHDGQMLKVNG